MTKEIKQQATGTTGFLCYSTDGTYFFRVYATDGFKDYDLVHSDLEITIKDNDAFFYETEEYSILDHSPATLGIKK